MSLVLLPAENVDFGKEMFWGDLFSNLETDSSTWSREYDDSFEHLDKYIGLNDKVLVAGCGDSILSFSLYNSGYCNITNIDMNSKLIKQMTSTYKTKCPLMGFEKMDILQMRYDSESFDVILDKGTLDSIMTGISDETVRKVDQMLTEISRVLKFGGHYIYISLLQPHILLKVLDWFSNETWTIRIHRCTEAKKSPENSLFSFPAFVTIFTKTKKLPTSTSILEIAMRPECQPRKMASVKEMYERLNSMQQFAMIKHHIKKRKIIDNNLCLELSCAETGNIKYRLYIVDLKDAAPLQYGIFIVPQGRGRDWLFCTAEGRLKCATDAKCERVIVVHVLCDVLCENMDAVKKELSGYMMELAPEALKSQVPFMSIGDDIGLGEIRKRGKSELSGEYVVQDVEEANKQFYRRLFFMDSPDGYQSKVKLKQDPNKKENEKSSWIVDISASIFDYQIAMVAGLTFLPSKMSAPKILQIGLGGGGLAMYLYHHFPNANSEVVELDPEVVTVAKEWFGVIEDERLTIKVDDGINVIKSAAEKGVYYDVVMIDADGKDISLGINSPPVDFITISTLTMLSKLIGEEGVAIINLICRSKAQKSKLFSDLKSIFSTVHYVLIPDIVNTIVYCTNQLEDENFMQRVRSRSEELCNFIKKGDDVGVACNVDDIVTSLEAVKI